MSSNELENEGFLLQIRVLLNERGIKLWEAPYITPDRTPNEEEMGKLADTLAPETTIPRDRCLSVLRSLQQNALEKLQAKDEFVKTGVATVKLRAPTQTGSNRSFDLKLKVTDPGATLSELVGQRLSVDPRKIKLVCGGRVVDSTRTLEEQKVTNGAIVLALVMAHSEEEAKLECSTYDRVHKIRADAELLINENDSAKMMTLEDQSGNPIFLPKNEKKSLMVALTLYAKGKAALSAGKYEEALLLLLEADRDFRGCNSDLLNGVDNYALLNLDIVWCYLCLKNLNQLPDAAERLQLCEQKFRQSYGENMKRVAALKGEQSSEKTILVRLHLLKAILYYHQNKRDDARTMFRVVETELQSLRIDDACLSRLMECGHTLHESRMALRACSNDIERAIEYIHEQRERQEANEKRSRRELKLYERIGHATDTPQYWRIKLDLVDVLMEMGYTEELAALALKESDNDINGALNELQNNSKELRLKLLRCVVPDEQLVEQLIALGFPEEAARVALKTTTNRYDLAAEFLVANVSDGSVYSERLTKALQMIGPETAIHSAGGAATESSDNQATPSTSKGSSNSNKRTDPITEARSEEKRRKKEMLDIVFKSFSKEIGDSRDNHLDLSLAEETVLLEQYKALLGME
ncbi:NEDD8 ultimate buster 1 [Anopheles aquasalis]|uniref:NEDD8 ultimate buster 1 n=1 Tax=Anopheles aquasalis TaxID=42839 RepID=UPI00215B042C|nr:NEDD8 ultimate buster 1 [Anopheles aquasalis]